MDYEKFIGVTEDFPKKGISFKDVSPLLADGEAFRSVINDMSKIVDEWKPDVIIGPESRGFLFGVPVAYNLGIGFIMARKKGKLPGKVYSKTYTLEYNTTTIELPACALKKGMRVVLVDDLLATGGTLNAVKELVEEQGASVVGVTTLIELGDLKGRDLFKDVPYKSIMNLLGA